MGTIFGIVLTIMMAWIVRPKVEPTSKPWFDISPDVKKKITESLVHINAGGSVGAGCEVEPKSQIYLTSLHVIATTVLDGDPIYVNNREAKLVVKSKSKDDFAVLTTLPVVPKDIKFESIDYLPFGENIIIAGHPASFENFIQPGKTLDAATDNMKNSIPGLQNFTAQIAEIGISGGCVYLEDGTGPIGVAIKRQNDGTYSAGIMTLVRKK